MKYNKYKFQIYIIWATIFLDLMGITLIIPFINELVEQLGGDERHAGLLLASYALMQFIFAPILGKISDKYGRRPVLLFGMLGASIAFLIFSFANQLWLLFVSRMFAGISNANISVAQAYIADITNPKERTVKMGIIQAAFSLGFIIGFPIGGILSEQFSISTPSILASSLSMINAIFAYFLLPESLNQKNRKMESIVLNPLSIIESSILNIKNYYQNQKFKSILIIFFLYSFAFSILHVTFVEFNREYLKMNSQKIGFIFMYIGIIGFLIQMFFIKSLIKIFNEENVMIIGFSLMAFGLVLTPFVDHMNWLFLTTFFVSSGNSLIAPTATSLISQKATKSEQGLILGITQSLGSLGRIFGPPFGGLTYYTIHMMFPFISAAIVLIGSIIFYQFMKCK
ncbi:MAG: MFS transporter [Candidatus Neomarinimicrobiota bacterium]|nr:MFS transporter [Candidatus Neomarinimicrobiota bacterium]